MKKDRTSNERLYAACCVRDQRRQLATKHRDIFKPALEGGYQRKGVE